MNIKTLFGAEEITSAGKQKDCDVSSADFVWNSASTGTENKPAKPFKLVCDGDYKLQVLLWDDYRGVNKYTVDDTLAGVYPFHKGENNALIAKVYTGVGDSASTSTSGSVKAVR